MKRNEICKHIEEILNKIFVDITTLPQRYDESYAQHLDSLRFVSLVVELENTFNIEFEDDDFEVEKVESINKIYELVTKYLT